MFYSAYYGSAQDWDFYLQPPPGIDITTCSRLVHEFKQQVKNCVGFTFNGLLIYCREDDTPETITEKYHEALKKGK